MRACTLHNNVYQNTGGSSGRLNLIPYYVSSDQAVTIQTDPKEVPPITAWEVEAALRKMKNGKEAGRDQVNIETLKAGDETIAKQLAKLNTKCITERHIPKHGRKQIW